MFPTARVVLAALPVFLFARRDNNAPAPGDHLTGERACALLGVGQGQRGGTANPSSQGPQSSPPGSRRRFSAVHVGSVQTSRMGQPLASIVARTGTGGFSGSLLALLPLYPEPPRKVKREFCGGLTPVRNDVSKRLPEAGATGDNLAQPRHLSRTRPRGAVYLGYVFGLNRL